MYPIRKKTNELITNLNVNFVFGGFLIKINISIINQNNKRILQPVTKAYKKSIDIIY